jgi:hypothetical protein
MPRSNAARADSPEQQFTTSVEAKADGQWLAVVNLGEGASVCKLFDNEVDALHYGEELSAWLASRRSG